MKSFISTSTSSNYKSVLEQRGKLVTLLVIVALFFWLHTIANTKIIQFPADPFYYIKMLSFTYWAGISVIIIAFLIMVYYPVNRAKSLVEISFIFVVALYIFGIPCFIYDNPRFLDVFGVAELVKYLNNAGHLIGNVDYIATYPVVVTFLSIISQINEMNPLDLGRYYPLFTSFLLLFFIYTFARKATLKYAVIAPAAYATLGWSQSYHMSPANYGLLLTVVLLVLWMSLINSNTTYGKVVIKVLVIIVLGVLIFAHALTPLINLITLLSLFALYSVVIHIPQIKRLYTLDGVSLRIQFITGFITILSVAYLAYTFYNSYYVASRIVVWGEDIFSNIITGDLFVFVDRNVTTPTIAYEVVNNIRWLSIAITMALSIFSISYLLFNHKYINWSITMAGFFIGYMGFSASLVIAGFSVFGAERGFIFGITPVVILWTLVLADVIDSNNKSTVIERKSNLTARNHWVKLYPIVLTAMIIFFVIISMLAIPITKYSSDPYAFVSQSEMAGKLFVEGDLNLSRSLGYKYYGSDYMYNNYAYNLLELKQQGGKQYREGFTRNTLNGIYSSGDQCQIYIQVQ